MATKTSTGAGWQRAVITLTGTVVGVVVIVTLYWAQSVFIPLALAGFLTFLLSPFVTWFRQQGLPRTPAVILVVLCAATALGGVGWLVTEQISSLLQELPKYRHNIQDKVQSVKKATGNLNEIQKIVSEINQESGKRPGEDQGRKEEKGASAGDADVVVAGDNGEGNQTGEGGSGAEIFSPRRPTAVIVEPQGAAWMSRLTSFLSPLLEYLGELALAIILVIFMLLKREELRNRIIRLAGEGKIVVATKFVDEAGQRVSRFLLMQAMVNGAFGLIFGLGLLLIGVKYALLWGFLGAMLRYLPYIGPYLAVTFPISLSLAMSEGWGTTLMVIGLFLTLELIISNFIEPRLYGQSMGVSEIALLVSAAFWAFLWGPIGLVLSSPLTVCLVVLGRYTPRLEFLSVILGDEPALDKSISFYQRLLARDQDEAEDLILEHIKGSGSPEEVYDAMLLPALGAIKRNRVRGDITEDDERYALQSIQEIVEDLGQRQLNEPPAGQTEEESRAEAETIDYPAIPIFGCPAHDAEDRMALEMLKQVLEPARWRLEVIAPSTLTSELLDQVADREPALVCIAATPPGGLAHTRYLCKRLRSRFPDLKILVGRWGLRDIANATQQAGTDPAEGARLNPMLASLQEAGADLVATTLLETRQQLSSLLPVLVRGHLDGPGHAVSDEKGRNGPSHRHPIDRRGGALEVAASASSP
ncbi:MAG: AI-2E family transporter [Isosphaeraceae bacterium]